MVSSCCTCSSHIYSKCLGASLPSQCMAHPPSMAFQVTTFRDGILLNTIQASSMLPHLHTCPPSYSPRRHQTLNRLNNLLMNTPAPFKGNYAGTGNQHPTKVIESGNTPSYCICPNSSSAFYPCPHFTCPNIMVLQVTTSQNSILLKTVQTSSRLPHLAYTKLLPTKTSASKPLWMMWWWTRWPSSSATTLAHAFSTPKS